VLRAFFFTVFVKHFNHIIRFIILISIWRQPEVANLHKTAASVVFFTEKIIALLWFLNQNITTYMKSIYPEIDIWLTV